MSTTEPPPLPPLSVKSPRRTLPVIIVAVGIILFGTPLLLHLCNLARLFKVPTGAMAPAVSPGDHFFMEGVTYRFREPRLGEIVVFKTDGLPLPAGEFYVKRVVGLPGDHVVISNGMLSINDKRVSLTNETGEISYFPPPMPKPVLTDVQVPAGELFVLGDTSTNSYDSRFFGCVPRGNIIGRVYSCYWPPKRAGRVK